MNFKFDKNGNENFLKGKKISITVSYFYQDLADKLLIATQKTLAKYGIKEDNTDVFYVPGAFEIPLIS